LEERPFDEIIDATCPSCRGAVPPDANVCPHCGYKIRPEAAKPAPPPKKPSAAVGGKPMTSKPLIGGILVVISGIFGLILGGVLAGASTMVDDLFGGMVGGDIIGMVEGVLVACGVIWIIIGLIALIGGVFAVMRKRWGLAVLGGVFGLFTIGPYLLGTIFGLVGLILIAMSKDEFT